MKKVFILALLVCGLILAFHVVMTVVTERSESARWSYTEEGQAGLKALINRRIDPFEYGGEPVNSALILNFRGDEDPLTTDAVASWVFFDFAGRGQAVKTGWVGPQMGLLVYEIDGDRKLFSNQAFDGDPRAATGFAALAALDENGDGLVDARDSGWANIRVWLDKKPDGRIGRNELYHPRELKIAALEVSPKPENRLLKSGNFLHSRGAFIYANGRRGGLDEVFFQKQAGYIRFGDEMPVSSEVAALAPDLKGRGRLRAFREAMTQSPELQAVFRRYQNAPTRQRQLALIDELLLAWARAGEAVPTLHERLGDRYDLTGNCLENLNPDHLRRLEVIEAWTGRDFYRLPHELYPGQRLLPGVETTEDGGRELKIACPNDRWQLVIKNYDRLSRYIYEGLLRNTRLKRFYDLADLDASASLIENTDFSRVLALFEDEYALDPETALTDLMEFRLDIARDSNIAKAGRLLDDYIKAKVEQGRLTPDQEALYLRFPASHKAAPRPAVSPGPEADGGSEEGLGH